MGFGFGEEIELLAVTIPYAVCRMKTEDEATHTKNILVIERVLLSGETVSSIPKPSVLEVSYFQSGGGNHLYLIEADGHRYLVRVNFYPLKNAWRMKSHEFACLKLLEPIGIAPKAYFIDADGRFLDQHFMIVDFVEGSMLRELNDASIFALADTLKTLHTSIVFDRPGNAIPPTDALPYVCNVFREFADGADKSIEQYEYLPGMADVVEPFNRVKSKLGAWFEQQRCFRDCSHFSLCHADLKRENILQTADGIKLIDWECAGSDVPEIDIGRLFSGCQFTKDQEKLFLTRYYSAAPEPILREGISAVRTVLDFFRILEDYILLKRKPWNPLAMKEELERFEKRIAA